MAQDGTERITALHVWDAWEDDASVKPRNGPRWFAAVVVTHSQSRWFDPRAQRMFSRVLVWNVRT